MNFISNENFTGQNRFLLVQQSMILDNWSVNSIRGNTPRFKSILFDYGEQCRSLRNDTL